MFARSCPRMGVRFASGNVFYMNRTFSARHLQCVASPLSTGFISPMRFVSTSAVPSATQWSPLAQCSSEVVPCDPSLLMEGVAASMSDVMPPPSIIDMLGSLHLMPSLKLTTVCCDHSDVLEA